MAILWPAFALFLLTMLVVARLATLRFGAVRGRQVDRASIRFIAARANPSRSP